MTNQKHNIFYFITMETSFNTQNSYFDHRIDRLFKPPNQEYVMLIPKGRKLFWHLKFNYPGLYNLRIQLYMPKNNNRLYSKSIESGFWTPGEIKKHNRHNLHDIYVNDKSQRLVWFDMGSFNIETPGAKQFYIEKLRSGKPFGVAKICFEYCDNVENINSKLQPHVKDINKKMKTYHDKLMEELNVYYKDHNMLTHCDDTNNNTTNDESDYVNVDETLDDDYVDTVEDSSIEISNVDSTDETSNNLNVNETVKDETSTIEPVIENIKVETVDASDVNKNQPVINIPKPPHHHINVKSFESGIHNIYMDEKYDVESNNTQKENVKVSSLLPCGVTGMIEEIVPVDEFERKELYHAKPAFLLSQSPENIEEIGGIYRELKVMKHEQYTYYTVSFSGGHVGLVLDGKHGYIKMELESSPDICSVIDKHPNAVTTENGKVNVVLPYHFKEGTKYKIFIRTKHIALAKKIHTVYYCYFEHTKTKKWRFLGAIAKPGEHELKTVNTSIENIDSINGHLYTRKLRIGNTWVFDKDKHGKLISNMTFIAKDPSNSTVFLTNNNRIELQIGGKVAGDTKESKTEFEITGHETTKIPNVPWESIDHYD